MITLRRLKTVLHLKFDLHDAALFDSFCAAFPSGGNLQNEGHYSFPGSAADAVVAWAESTGRPVVWIGKKQEVA